MWVPRSLPGAHQKTLAADKGDDSSDFLADRRNFGIPPQVAKHMLMLRALAIVGRAVRGLVLRPADPIPQSVQPVGAAGLNIVKRAVQRRSIVCHGSWVAGQHASGSRKDHPHQMCKLPAERHWGNELAWAAISADPYVAPLQASLSSVARLVSG